MTTSSTLNGPAALPRLGLAACAPTVVRTWGSDAPLHLAREVQGVDACQTIRNEEADEIDSVQSPIIALLISFIVSMALWFWIVKLIFAASLLVIRSLA